jgi:hypothetical protein
MRGGGRGLTVPGNHNNLHLVLLISVYRVLGGALRELEEAPYTVLAEHMGWEERESIQQSHSFASAEY